jgi:hypothetical protein
MNLGALYEAKPHFLHTPTSRGIWGVFIGGEEDLHYKVEVVWSIWTADRLYTWLAGQPSRPLTTLGVTDLSWHVYETVFENTPNPGRPAMEVGPTGLSLAQLGPGFVPRHPHMSYCLWQCLILDIMKICTDFSAYDTFPSSDVPEMVNQQNSWNSLVVSTYLLYLKWNLGMLAVDMCILWPPIGICIKGLLKRF